MVSYCCQYDSECHHQDLVYESATLPQALCLIIWSHSGNATVAAEFKWHKLYIYVEIICICVHFLLIFCVNHSVYSIISLLCDYCYMVNLLILLFHLPAEFPACTTVFSLSYKYDLLYKFK
jgi:hypothetical protein